jgi:hypothetical protein
MSELDFSGLFADMTAIADQYCAEKYGVIPGHAPDALRFATSFDSNARHKYLFNRRPRSAWERRSDRAKYPNRPSLSAEKYRYRWAEASWLSGYLDSATFLREAERFDAAFEAERFRESAQRKFPVDVAKEERRLRRIARGIEGEEPYFDRLAWERLAAAKERIRRWQDERQARMATAHQRRKLREGHRTLTTIRRHLRGAVALPPPESRQARTSPTS